MDDQQHKPDGSKSTTNEFSGPSATEVAWAAGFVDGEGCIHISKQRLVGRYSPTYRLCVHVSQNDRPVLEALCSAVGIPARIYKVPRAKNHTRQCYTVNFTGQCALRLLQVVLQYLKRKRAEAEAALRFWVEGAMGIPGKGKRLAPDVIETRERYFLLLKSLK